jgi:ketosteroid isomerase-like protein
MKICLAIALVLSVASCNLQKAKFNQEEEKIVQCWMDWPKKSLAGHPEFYFADNAVITGQKIPSARGKNEIINFYAAMPKMPGMVVKWNEKPNIIHFSKSGDMAYSIDTLRISVPDSTGIVQTTVNQGIHVWSKDPEGNWKVVLLTMYPY